VVVVEEGASIAKSASADDQLMIADRLAERGVKVLTGQRVVRFTADRLVVEGAQGERTIFADTVMYDFGRVPDEATTTAFAYAHPEVVAIGDCDETGVIGAAIRRGFFTAWAIR